MLASIRRWPIGVSPTSLSSFLIYSPWRLSAISKFNFRAARRVLPAVINFLLPPAKVQMSSVFRLSRMAWIYPAVTFLSTHEQPCEAPILGNFPQASSQVSLINRNGQCFQHHLGRVQLAGID